jgi:transposase
VEMGRYLVEAVLVEGRRVTELARSHDVSRWWIYKLLARYKEGGYAALEARSRRPKSCSHQTSDQIVAEVVRLRQELTESGFDAGPQTILHHLQGKVDKMPSAATIWRILKRQGLIAPEPHKRPRSSFVRFEAELPNETWQCDATAWQLADGSSVEILNLEDDHSRLFLNSTAHTTVKAGDVVEAFFVATDSYGLPASFLSDNAAVFSGRSRRGKVALELELESLGIEVKHSTPTTPRPAARSSGSIRPLRSSWPSRHRPPRSLFCRLSSTPSASTTTTTDPTAPSAGRPRWLPSTPASRPVRLCPSRQPITGFARTASTRPAGSRCAT